MGDCQFQCHLDDVRVILINPAVGEHIYHFYRVIMLKTGSVKGNYFLEIH